MSLAAPVGRLRRLSLALVLVALGSAMLMWTAAVNGRPAVFTDTALYYSEGQYLFEALGWRAPAQAVKPPADPTRLPDTPGAADISAAIDGARSVAYAAPLYALQRLGGLWLVAWAQALAVAAILYALFRAAAPSAPRWGYLALMAGVSLLTPLPFFVGWAMPDVFAGAAACGVALLLLYPDSLSSSSRITVTALTAYGLSVHRSNLLDALVVTLAVAMVLRLAGLTTGDVSRRVAWVVGATVLAVGAGALLDLPIAAKAGEPIGSPPFLSARVLADGPGRLYLRRACARDPHAFVLCRFAAEPLATSDQILWSNRRRSAVFVAATPVQRLELERQDARFALASTLADPVGQMRASAWNALQQFGEAYVDDPARGQAYYLRDAYWRQTALPRIIPDPGACVGKGGCPPRVGTAASGWLEGIGLLAATVFLGWRLTAPDVRAAFKQSATVAQRAGVAQIVGLAGFVLVLLAVNACICGVLSGPFPRYQARLVWLWPTVAGLTLAQLGPRRRPAPKVASTERPSPGPRAA